MDDPEHPMTGIDSLFDDPDDTGENTFNRSKTPFDPVLADTFTTTPLVQNPRRARTPKKVSVNIFSSSSALASTSASAGVTGVKKVLPGVSASNANLGGGAGPAQGNRGQGAGFSNREGLLAGVGKNGEATMQKGANAGPRERPARTIQEETSYDDEEDELEVVAGMVQAKDFVSAKKDANAKNASSMDKRPSPGVPSVMKSSIPVSIQPPPSIFGGNKTQNPSKNSKPQPHPISTAAIRKKSPVIEIEDDSDDDFMEIDPKSASQEAQDAWAAQAADASRASQKRKSTNEVDGDVVVKKERSSPENVPRKSGDSATGRSRPNSGPDSPPPTQLNQESQSSSQHNQQSQSFGALPTPKESQPRPQNARPKQDMQSIVAAQQAMLNKKKVQPRNGAFANRPTAGSSQAESSSAGAARFQLPRRPAADEPEHRQQQNGESSKTRGPAQKDDHTWMDEDDDDDGPDIIHQERLELQEHLRSLEKEGTINEEQKLTLHKLNKDLEAKRRMDHAAKRARTPNSEDEGELFVSDRQDARPLSRPNPTRGLGNDDNDLADDSNDDDDGNEAMQHMLEEHFGKSSKDFGLTKTGKPRKRALGTTKRALNARDFFTQQQDNREKERSKAQKKKGRQAAAPKSAAKTRGQSSRGRGGMKGKSKGRNSKKDDKSKSKKKKGPISAGKSLLNGGYGYHTNDQVGQMMLDDLVANDPIADRMGPVFDNLPPEPNIQGPKRKETQFQTLFANIPQNAHATSSSATDKKLLREASKSFGFAKCKAVDGKWLIKGMKSTLYHHQLLGAQWMVQRELSGKAPHGGLLADSMGLGKTVQTLALMCGNPPPKEDSERGVKATLVVVPAAVLNQWWEEIDLHCEKKTFLKVMRYRSSSPISRAVLEDLDIVLTTYHEVMKEFPFPSGEDREKISRVGYQRWWRRAIQNLGPLHQISWYRVVLDEAQAIKNHSARTSLACQNLKSIFRWCLTGTPLLNRLEELFPYLRFLKANYTMDMQTFQKYFCDSNAEECYSRISTLLSYCMMRRTMKTTILNRPIITLPMPHPEIMNVDFSPEEKIIYRITENRFRDNLNMYFAKREARRNYGVFMVQLLRLRQCTSHPFMLERTIRESWTLEDVEALKTQLAKLSKNTAPFYKQCKVWVGEIVKRRDGMKEEGRDTPLDEYTEDATELLPFGAGSYGEKFDISSALKTVSEKELYLRVTCGLCSDFPTDPVKGDCGHMFCKQCFQDSFQLRLAEGQEPDILTCPVCMQILNKVEDVNPATLSVRNPFDDEDASSARHHNRGSQEKRIHESSLGKDAMGAEPSTDETWLTRSDIDENFCLTPSAKTAAMKAILLKGFKEAPVDKVVIYVQFRTLARIVGRICKGEGWGFLYLTGDSSLDHRSKAIKMFRDDDNIKILIAGLKCGGLGLNFPWANRCISLDLWWNHAVEQQAFGRIFRIGQQKETYMTRIVVKNSVDQRMLTMQLHKLQSLEKAIRDEPDGESKATLSIKQLANLFGFLRTSADGEIVSIEPDYVDDNGEWEGNSSSNSASGAAGAAGPDRAPRSKPRNKAKAKSKPKSKGKGKGKATAVNEDETESDEDFAGEENEVEAEEMMEDYERGEHGGNGEYGKDGGDYDYSGLGRGEFMPDETMDMGV